MLMFFFILAKYFDQNRTFEQVKSQCFPYTFVRETELTIFYFEPNFVEIRLRESGFSIFVVLRNHAERKSVKWPPF